MLYHDHRDYQLTIELISILDRVHDRHVYLDRLMRIYKYLSERNKIVQCVFFLLNQKEFTECE